MKRRIIYTLALVMVALQAFSQTYTYDNLYRLTKVVYSNGITVTYGYDALGNRTSKKVTGASSSTAIPGDVNGDGLVSSVDVTVLYNYLLNNDMSFIVNGDQDGDGIITAVDITIIYNLLLGNSSVLKRYMELDDGDEVHNEVPHEVDVSIPLSDELEGVELVTPCDNRLLNEMFNAWD